MITLFYGSLLGCLLLALSGRVIYLRRRHSVGIGAGEHRDLEKAIRAHANLIEYVPLALILIALLELSGTPARLVHGLGAALVASRLLHAWGLSRHSGRSIGRLLGTAGTVLVILTASVLGLLTWIS